MKSKRNLWYLAAFAIAALVTLFVFGTEGLEAESSMDINWGDTYYVIPTRQVMGLITLTLFLGLSGLGRFFKK